MVSSVAEKHIPRLPLELWVKVFSNLCGPDLFRCEAVCRDWRQEIRHQVDIGLVTRRGLRCQRLILEPSGCMEHRRSVWDSISLMADTEVLITGVGVYSPSGHTQVCVDARPIEDTLRPIDVATLLDSSDEDEGRVMTLFGRPRLDTTGKPFRFHLLPGQWWELMLNIKPASRSYDPMSGNTTWTARGAGGQSEVRSHGVTFTFRRTERPGWRSSVEDGQIPHFYFWKL